MKYKLIISDFDGTLNYDHFNYTCSQRTDEAIQEFILRGGFFCLSTGRAWQSIRPCLVNYGLDKISTLVACDNGSTIHDSKTGEILYEQTVNKPVLLDLLQYLYELGLDTHLVSGDNVYVDKALQYMKDFANRVEIVLQEMGDLRLFAQQCDFDFHKCAAVWSKQQELDVGKLFASRYPELDFTVGRMVSGEFLIEITSIKAGKGNTAIQMAKMCNVPISNTIAIGDADNDVSMIQSVGLGICVGNAIDKLKAVAKLTTDASNNDGVAKVIEKALRDELP